MNNCFILLTLLILFVTGCASNESPPPKDSKLVKEITEILDAIEKEPMGKRFLSYPGTLISSGANTTSDILSEHTEIKLLIGNSNISLPLMFERFGKLPKASKSLALYFIVFEHTKSAEAIPYIADFLAYCNGKKEVPTNLFGLIEYAELAAENITNIHDSLNALQAFYIEELSDKRLEIINRLNQWYEEYKKSHK